MHFIIYLVILVAFLALMFLLYYWLTGGGVGMIKYIKDIFRFGK